MAITPLSTSPSPQSAPKEVITVKKSWHYDKTNPHLPKKNYTILPATQKDVEKVVKAYMLHPVPGQKITNVRLIHNFDLESNFISHLKKLQTQKNTSTSAPNWEKHEHVESRNDIYKQYLECAEEHKDKDYPAVQLLPLWHGTNPSTIESIYQKGYADLPQRDEGYFGKGLYFNDSAEYTHYVCKGGSLILNWVSSLFAYPALHSDVMNLAGRTNVLGFDAHFIPTIYDHAATNYLEMVIFNPSQALPRYQVDIGSGPDYILPSITIFPAKTVAEEITPAKASTSSPKTEVASFIIIETKKVVTLPSIAFGAAKWAEYFGEVGTEPPLPADIDKILKSSCPFFSDKTVGETHLLTLIPETVDGKPFTLNRLEELIQKPKKGSATKYRYYWDEIQKEHGDTPNKGSYWVLLTNNVIPNSRSKTYGAQKKLVEAKESYQVPLLLEAATSILMEYVQSGTRLYNDKPWTYTRCQERVSKHSSLPLVVGGFAPAGLAVSPYVGGDESNGVGGSRKFSSGVLGH